MQRGVLLCVPGVVDRNYHLYGATTEELAIPQRVARFLPHDQSAYVWKSEDLVERDGHKIGCRDRVRQVQRCGARKCSCVQKRIRWGLVKRLADATRPALNQHASPSRELNIF